MFTIGSDIEFAVIENGSPISAEHLILGTKWEPIRLPGGFMLSHDNVLAEVATPVSDDEDGFVESVGQAIRLLSESLAGRQLSRDAAVLFPQDQLMSHTAMQFGCDPDYNAWTEMENEPPLALGNQWRSCGAHVHVGGRSEFQSKEGAIELGRWMDVIMGTTMTTIFHSDGERIRRRLYGRSGCIRRKPYGVEYRSLSNGWSQSEEGVRAVYRLAKDSAEAARSGIAIDWFVDKDMVSRAINFADPILSHEVSLALMVAGLISNNSQEMVEQCHQNI